jgi:phenylalanine-4-hydroxylase
MATEMSTELRDIPRPIVHLDPDHPGFRDTAYRARRNAIARLAADYVSGTEIPAAPYTESEHALWGTIWDALEPAHLECACREYLACSRVLGLPKDRIPQLDEVTRHVEGLSGFRLEPVAGLVEPRIFLESLAAGVFLSTQYIRHDSSPFYTPEPDVVHEIAGHAVTLASERLAILNRLFGEAVRRARGSEAVDRLSRVYWFTLEFGVVREAGRVKAYGAGLLSSAGEMRAMAHAELRPFDLDRASAQAYDPTTYQPVLYCADSFDEMFERLRDYLARAR